MHQVHEFYESGIATRNTAANIFNDQWVSRLPGLEIGTVPLFQDSRVEWGIEQAGGLQGKHCLELGPLEGAHTYMLLNAGAASVTAIEANSRCFLKCLVTKELYGMDRAQFLFGNFVPWLEQNTQTYDYVHAAGVLYHMIDPVCVLQALCRATNRIYLWTHYADLEAMPATDPRYVAGIVRQEVLEDRGLRYSAFRRRYLGNASSDPKFCGGVHEDPIWIEKSTILAILHAAGFTTKIAHDTPDHPNGPACSIFASR